MRTNSTKTRTIVGLGLLTAIVVVLQLLGSFIHIGPFNISFVLMPIVVGAALFGVWAGAWLGFVFGLVVLFTDPTVPFFMAHSVVLTIILVLLKGVLAGILSGLVYKLLGKKHSKAAVFVAAAICPIVNTGIFLLGCKLLFSPVIEQLASLNNVSVGKFIGTIILLFNFLPELIVNIVLCPAIIQIIKYGEKSIAKK